MDFACLVMDTGTGLVKAEKCTAQAPRIFPNIVGSIKHGKEVIPLRLQGCVDGMFASSDTEAHRGLLKLSYPMDNGHVTDWNGMERVWRYVVDKLQVVPSHHPVLMTEAPNTSRPQRERTAEILFEKFNVPHLLFSVQAVLSLYASGNQTGVVLDVGDGVAHACAIADGYPIRGATQRADYGGRDITKFLQVLMRQYGSAYLDTSAEFEIVRQIKEERCEVLRTSVDSSDIHFSLGDKKKTKHKLPDGTEISLGMECFQAPEALFRPQLMGKEAPGVTDMVLQCIKKSDMVLRKSLYEAVFLAGGSTKFSNFMQRLADDGQKQVPRGNQMKVFAPPDRDTTTWLGGSILAQLQAFKQMLTSKQQWDEHGGARIIHQRALI